MNVAHLGWRLHRDSPTIVLSPEGTSPVALCYKPEDAALIVRALESHEAMAFALRRAFAVLRGDITGPGATYDARLLIIKALEKAGEGV